MVSTHSSLLEGTGGELEPYLGGGGEFERTHAHPHMPALVMVLKYVKLVTGDLSARVPSLRIRKPLPDSLYCWPLSVKCLWLAFK